MMQIYSDPRQETNPTALPDCEVFYVTPQDAMDDAVASSAGWYWWARFPGCLPASDPNGPHATEQKESPSEALARIESGFSKNDALVIALFAARGIEPALIEPRVNVFTYKAWRAKGRQVCKGEKSVRISTYIPVDAVLDPVTGKVLEPASSRPWTASVFHISQTKAIELKVKE